MSTEANNQQQRTQALIVGGILVAIIAVFALVNAFQASSEDNQANTPDSYTQAILDAEEAAASHLEASLRFYYVTNVIRQYPVNIDSLYDEQENSLLEDNVNKWLKDFKYSVRGDYQAYKFTYTDSLGEQQTVEGNYREDYR